MSQMLLDDRLLPSANLVVIQHGCFGGVAGTVGQLHIEKCIGLVHQNVDDMFGLSIRHGIF